MERLMKNEAHRLRTRNGFTVTVMVRTASTQATNIQVCGDTRLTDVQQEALAKAVVAHLDTFPVLSITLSKEELHERLNKRLEDVMMTTRAHQALERVLNGSLAKRYVGDLAKKSRADFGSLKNCGRKTVRELEHLLSELNLHFGLRDDELMGWRSPSQDEKADANP